MRAKVYQMLPSTVQFNGNWTLHDYASVYQTVCSWIDVLPPSLVLHYEQRFVQESVAKALCVFDCYRASMTCDDTSIDLVPEAWDCDYFVRRLVARLRADHPCPQASPIGAASRSIVDRPHVVSPLETGRWYTKRAFEKQYRSNTWGQIVMFARDGVEIHVQAYALQQVLKRHKEAYFQFAWNQHPCTRNMCVPVRSRRQAGSSIRLTTITDRPNTTVLLRICYAMTPQQDTEEVLYDGYGLPEHDRWWQRAEGYRIQLTLH